MTPRTRKPPKLPQITEAMVTEQIIGWLRAKGWLCERVQSGLMQAQDGRRIRIGNPGIPDWNCFKGARYFKLEIKRPGKELSADQLSYFARCKRDKINVMWADSIGSFLARFECEPWSIER